MLRRPGNSDLVWLSLIMLTLLLSKFSLYNIIISGTTWGIGGTCVNVGCIPKKLFHISTQVKENILMGEDYGWGKYTTDNGD